MRTIKSMEDKYRLPALDLVQRPSLRWSRRIRSF